MDIGPVHNISLLNYHIEHTRTEALKGGNLLYISDKIYYKPRKDLETCYSRKIESTCIEIINAKSKNTTVACICKHHTITNNSNTLTQNIERK